MENQDQIKNSQVSESESKSELKSVSKAKFKKNPLMILLYFVVAIIIVTGLIFVLINPVKENTQVPIINKEPVEEVLEPTADLSGEFAKYEESAIKVKPQVPVYKANQDLSNITNAVDYTFSEEAEQVLVKNSFVVKPSYYEEFFPLYEANRYDYTPSFVTTDSILHSYHLMFDFLLKQLEEQKLTRELKDLNSKMLTESLKQYNELKGTAWENSAKRNLGFFAVGSKLLDPTIKIPDLVKSQVNQELALIEAHQGIEESPVMSMGAKEGLLIETPQGLLPLEGLNEDYSQYIPRGHYDKTEELRAYFKSMMWYGRLSFRLKNEDEVKSALLITLALNNNNNNKSWDKIYEPINFFVGKSDDITYYNFKDLISETYGQNISTADLLSNEANFVALLEKAKALEAPQINSMPVFEASIQADRESEIKAFRFLGQRFTIDAAIFQKLIYREVGDKSTTCQNFDPAKASCLTGARCLPQGLDIPATLGSREAKNILRQSGETQYSCYLENLDKMNKYVSGLSTATWTQNLYWGWLHQLRPLLEEKGKGYPAFMLSSAWQRKDLNTFLGSWSQLKHDTILYAKQVYAELGGMMPEKKDDKGYVEPNPQLYARLSSLLSMTSQGLESRQLLEPNMKENLNNMEKLATSLRVISEKELENKSLSEEEYELIRSYGGQLEHLWLEINKDEKAFQETGRPSDFLQENPAAIIADVATDPNGRVLEVGTGKISEIYVVVPIDGKLRIAKGGVYSYYEFVWPMSDRLTDQKWRALLDSAEAPALPEWTSSFVAN